MVGATRFEHATPCSQSRCSTRLSYAPNSARRVVLPSPQGSVKLARDERLGGKLFYGRMHHLITHPDAEFGGAAAFDLEHGLHVALR